LRAGRWRIDNLFSARRRLARNPRRMGSWFWGNRPSAEDPGRLAKAYWMEVETVMTWLQAGAPQRSREGVRRVAEIEHAALPGGVLIRISHGGGCDRKKSQAVRR
jgi:hypothetical protein